MPANHLLGPREPLLRRLDADGYALLSGAFSSADVDAVTAGLTAAPADPTDGDPALRSQSGGVYGSRNVLTLWPPSAGLWRRPPLVEVLNAVLSPAFGLVRVLYFDKPPGGTWALPWHKDLTVAVRDNRLPSTHFGKPTRKAGVPHAEAPLGILEGMLTARLHLDDVTEENGPLKVLPGSHRTGKELRLGEGTPASVLAGRGDVLLMRPLLAHASGRSHPETRRHRRVLHFEFAASRDLPDGYEWHALVARG